MAYAKQSNDSFDDINRLIKKYLDDRDWLNGAPKNYAASIAIEAAELLEHYQWTDESVGSKQDVADELADILIYCFQFAMVTDIDIAEAIKHKLAKVAEKYPATDYKGKDKTERRANWKTAHQGHREKNE